MHPNPLPAEAGCLVRLVTRGERQAGLHGVLKTPFGNIPTVTIGTTKPDIYAVTVWHDGSVYHNGDLRSDLIGRPPTLQECLLHLAERHDRWSLVNAAA